MKSLEFANLRMPLSKKILRTAFARYSSQVDRLNRDARVAAWIRANKNIPVLKDRFNLYEYVSEHILAPDEPIDYIEFGVFRGESIKYWSNLNTNPKSRFFGFDSFEGLPDDWTTSIRSGHFSTGGQIPIVNDNRVTFIRGWFQETLRPFLASFSPRSRIVVHHDSDIYSSVLYCLTQTDFIMSPGTVVLFDEYSDPLNEFRALEDYRTAYMRRMRGIAMTAAYAEQAAFLME